MAAVTAQMVKALREKTGAGMMDCKKALGETEGDIEEAVDWLRKNGLSAAAKKAGRVAAEGVVAVVTSDGSGAMVEVNSETDFVARNEEFQGFAANLASMALETGNDLEAMKAKPFPGTDRTVEEQLFHNIATIGENMSLRRAIRLDVEGGVVVPYMHNAVVPGIGKIGVLVALKSSADVAVLERLGKQLAMHVAATAPQSMSVNDLDPTTVEREKTILTDQAKATGRPDNIIEKMVEGRLRKFYQEVVLLEQTFVVDNETKVATVIENAATEAGTPIELVGFERFTLGEGIEREEKDFAAEVAATLEN
jgi:elongation factor Ts